MHTTLSIIYFTVAMSTSANTCMRVCVCFVYIVRCFSNQSMCMCFVFTLFYRVSNQSFVFTLLKFAEARESGPRGRVCGKREDRLITVFIYLLQLINAAVFL